MISSQIRAVTLLSSDDQGSKHSPTFIWPRQGWGGTKAVIKLGMKPRQQTLNKDQNTASTRSDKIQLNLITQASSFILTDNFD